jgi:hypothetical protein
LGQLPLVDGAPAPGSNGATAIGWTSRDGTLLTFEYLRFEDLFEGAPSLVAWLKSHGFTTFRYEMRGEVGDEIGDLDDDMLD